MRGGFAAPHFLHIPGKHLHLAGKLFTLLLPFIF